MIRPTDPVHMRNRAFLPTDSAEEPNFKTTTGLGQEYMDKSCDYLLWYGKKYADVKYRELYKPKTIYDDVGGRHRRIQEENHLRRPMNLNPGVSIRLYVRSP